MGIQIQKYLHSRIAALWVSAGHILVFAASETIVLLPTRKNMKIIRQLSHWLVRTLNGLTFLYYGQKRTFEYLLVLSKNISSSWLLHGLDRLDIAARRQLLLHLCRVSVEKIFRYCKNRLLLAAFFTSRCASLHGYEAGPLPHSILKPRRTFFIWPASSPEMGLMIETYGLVLKDCFSGFAWLSTTAKPAATHAIELLARWQRMLTSSQQ